MSCRNSIPRLIFAPSPNSRVSASQTRNCGTGRALGGAKIPTERRDGRSPGHLARCVSAALDREMSRATRPPVFFFFFFPLFFFFLPSLFLTRAWQAICAAYMASRLPRPPRLAPRRPPTSRGSESFLLCFLQTPSLRRPRRCAPPPPPWPPVRPSPPASPCRASRPSF